MDAATELGGLVADISEKTGAEISFTPAGEGWTEVPLEYNGKTVTLYLHGTGETAEQLARMIAYLVSNADPASASDRKGDLRRILLGEGGHVRAFRYMTKYNIADGTCFAADVIPGRRREECLAHIERCLTDDRDAVIGMDDKRIAVVKFSDDEQTPYEFGQFLHQSLYEELGVRASIGIGCETSFPDVQLSYSQATTAIRLSGIFHGEGEVHSYREYLLVRMLEDVPKARLKEYMEQFRVEGAAEIFEDEDMTATAEAFLESSLNISETSRNLYMHRNTLTYRLDKIERATGLNIRKFSDAVTFRVITILYKLFDL